MRGQYPSRARGGISIVKRRAKWRRRDDLGTKKEGAVQRGWGLRNSMWMLHSGKPLLELVKALTLAILQLQLLTL